VVIVIFEALTARRDPPHNVIHFRCVMCHIQRHHQQRGQANQCLQRAMCVLFQGRLEGAEIKLQPDEQRCLRLKAQPIFCQKLTLLLMHPKNLNEGQNIFQRRG